MKPSIIFEAIAENSQLNALGIDETRIFESQSLDSRPHSDGHFITINMEEPIIKNRVIFNGERTVTIAVHSPADVDRDYSVLDEILFGIDNAILPIEQEAGLDGVTVTCIARQGRSGNLMDEGWNTITRNATYGVLYKDITG